MRSQMALTSVVALGLTLDSSDCAFQDRELQIHQMTCVVSIAQQPSSCPRVVAFTRGKTARLIFFIQREGNEGVMLPTQECVWLRDPK